MSRSYKKPVIRDRGCKSIYWRRVRSRNNQEVRTEKEISNPKELVNDYDYSDYRFINCLDSLECFCLKKYGFQKCSNK